MTLGYDDQRVASCRGSNKLLNIMTQQVQTRRQPDLCSKNVDPGSSLPALQRCKHMHLRKRAFETYGTGLVCIIPRSQAVSMDEKNSNGGCLQASDARLEMR